MKACVMLTCFNRKEKTINCIKSLINGNKSQMDFIVVDDGSSDGTAQALEEMAKELYEKDSEHASIEVIRAEGGLYYSGGMRKAMEAALRRYGTECAGNGTGSNDSAETGSDDSNGTGSEAGNGSVSEADIGSHDADYYVLINDDVKFDKGVLDEIAGTTSKMSGIQSENSNVSVNSDEPKDRLSTDSRAVIVGAMRDSSGKCSYGGVKYYSGIHYKQIGPDAADRTCDTFNANFVAVPKEVFKAVPIIDLVYIHSLGDFDYGLQIKKAGYRIEVTDHFVGTCDNNPSTGTWNDRTLSRTERIKRKESIKGAPAKQWFHFLNKNFGLGYALVYSLTPYIRILLGK